MVLLNIWAECFSDSQDGVSGPGYAITSTKETNNNNNNNNNKVQTRNFKFKTIFIITANRIETLNL
jgi:hypothetical protein